MKILKENGVGNSIYIRDDGIVVIPAGVYTISDFEKFSKEHEDLYPLFNDEVIAESGVFIADHNAMYEIQNKKVYKANLKASSPWLYSKIKLKFNYYLVDDNNNAVFAHLNNIVTAYSFNSIEILRSLTNCHNCVFNYAPYGEDLKQHSSENCYNCCDIVNCIDCEDCIECTNCSDCNNCIRCSDSQNISNSTGVKNNQLSDSVVTKTKMVKLVKEDIFNVLSDVFDYDSFEGLKKLGDGIEKFVNNIYFKPVADFSISYDTSDNFNRNDENIGQVFSILGTYTDGDKIENYEDLNSFMFEFNPYSDYFKIF